MLGLQTLLLQGTSVSGALPPELGSLPFLTTVNVRGWRRGVWLEAVVWF